MQADPRALAFNAYLDEQARHKPAGNAQRCKTCGAETPILHPDPDRADDIRRSVCGTCAGKSNARLMGRGGVRPAPTVDDDDWYWRGR